MVEVAVQSAEVQGWQGWAQVQVQNASGWANQMDQAVKAANAVVNTQPLTRTRKTRANRTKNAD